MWGAVAGGIEGVAAAATGSVFAEAAIPLGFIVGATSGMAGLGLFFPAYLYAVVRDRGTLHVVAAGVLVAPLAGWLGLAGLFTSTFGMWLFTLPFFVWIAVLADRSQGLELSGDVRLVRGSGGAKRRREWLSIG